MAGFLLHRANAELGTQVKVLPSTTQVTDFQDGQTTQGHVPVNQEYFKHPYKL